MYIGIVQFRKYPYPPMEWHWTFCGDEGCKNPKYLRKAEALINWKLFLEGWGKGVRPASQPFQHFGHTRALTPIFAQPKCGKLIHMGMLATQARGGDFKPTLHRGRGLGKWIFPEQHNVSWEICDVDCRYLLGIKKLFTNMDSQNQQGHKNPKLIRGVLRWKVNVIFLTGV